MSFTTASRSVADSTAASCRRIEFGDKLCLSAWWRLSVKDKEADTCPLFRTSCRRQHSVQHLEVVNGTVSRTFA
jgi:hypothetical protein